MDISAKIGENAGIVWAALNGKGLVSLGELTRATKLGRSEIDQAIGWLSREGKLEFQTERRGRTKEEHLMRIGLKAES